LASFRRTQQGRFARNVDDVGRRDVAGDDSVHEGRVMRGDDRGGGGHRVKAKASKADRQGHAHPHWPAHVAHPVTERAERMHDDATLKPFEALRNVCREP
jgi:hypothetical protein